MLQSFHGTVSVPLAPIVDECALVVFLLDLKHTGPRKGYGNKYRCYQSSYLGPSNLTSAVPTLLACGKICPAVVTGNTVIVKPSYVLCYSFIIIRGKHPTHLTLSIPDHTLHTPTSSSLSSPRRSSHLAWSKCSVAMSPSVPVLPPTEA